MKKKLTWIQTLNSRGSILGNGLPMEPILNPFTLIQFQKNFRAELGGEWEVDYISQDIEKLDEIQGDVIAIPQNLEGYIDLNQFKNAVIIPFIDIHQKNYNSIKSIILNHC
ncbi:MAG: hypothetical protein LKF42_00250 [Streptococcaceae bacterium]|jgi:aspartate/glutamate racemase|nr:hypothetical protein [Streptococcaceae bacterium]MCH4176163.1 hypothetical protein [Streptococcaceae bacterium]